MMGRFCVVWLALAMLLPGLAQAEDALWDDYAARFVQADGRVVDTGLGGISHSEAQGTAMLLAQRHNDQARFDRIWAWTRGNLGVRKDALFAWSWRPEGRNTEAHDRVPDKNSATDGDLLIAWALAEAGQRWHNADYRDAAGAIAKTLLTKLLRDTDAGPVLLPGSDGFESANGIAVNLSYAILPAYRALDALLPDPAWHRLTDATHNLIAAARFGRFSLPPDWLFVPKNWKMASKTPALSIWAEKPPRFGFDAVRVPLFLAWTGADGHELWPFLSFWGYFDPLPFHPPWTDLVENAVPLANLPPGFVSIRRLTEEATHPTHAGAPTITLVENEDYFSASLSLLADLAWRDRH
jgi:endoglucanase